MNALIDDAARMPLLDAAYALWRARRQLDAQERAATPARPRRRVRPGPSDAFKASVLEAFRAVHDERAHAHEGPTFQRLKRAHPEASDADLQDAVKAAVKLETDCSRYFSRTNPDYYENIRDAIRLAQADNPGFSEITYQRLFDYIAFVMK